MRKSVFLLLEIFIGISLFSILAFAGIAKYNEHIDTHPTYIAKFKDVDGLSIGSPVRFMGVLVGNVNKLELLDSEINVAFRITEKNIIIPDGSFALIQFTGLAGSRSLELIPPKKYHLKNKNKIYSEEPIRINSILEVQTAISENLLNFCNGLLAFFSRNSIDSTKKNMQSTSTYMQRTTESWMKLFKILKCPVRILLKIIKKLSNF